jgi:TPR repeat protein
MNRILKSLLVFVLLAAAGFAADDFAETKKKAEAGDATAQSKLGEMYANGTGVPKDLVQAV